jgi:hypothetical protein
MMRPHAARRLQCFPPEMVSGRVEAEVHARRILKGATYLITRRTLLRQCYLKQSDMPVIQQAIRFCLAHAANKYGFLVHAFQFLWTHYHFGGTDATGKLPLFVAWLDRHIALIVKNLRNIDENVFAVGSYSAVSLNAPIEVSEQTQKLDTPEDVLKALDYIELNAVRSRLVSCRGLWPGVLSWPDYLNRVFVIERPSVYFSKDSRLVPPTAELVITKPPQFADMPDAEFVELRSSRLRQGECDLRAEFAAQGLPFLGRRKVLRMKHTDRARSVEPLRSLNPHLAGKDRNIRIARIRSLRVFRRDHRAALIEFPTNPQIEFPAGTYRMRALLAARVRFPHWCTEPASPPGLPT